MISDGSEKLILRLPDTWLYVNSVRALIGANVDDQPEIFKKAGHGKPVDIWAIGVIR